MHPRRTKVADVALLLMTLAPVTGCAFGTMPAEADVTLEGPIWTVIEIHGDMPPEEADTEPFIRIDSSTGQVTGDTGCNTFTGPYRSDGARLVMGPLAVTRAVCGPEVDRFEEHMLEALRVTTLYRTRGGVLYLYPDSESPAHIRFEIGE